MPSLFSAYIRPAPVREWKLKLAALAAMSWGVMMAVGGAFTRAEALAILAASGLVWAFTIVHGLRRSGRMTLGLAALGATLLVVGLLAVVLAPSGGCTTHAPTGADFNVTCI